MKHFHHLHYFFSKKFYLSAFILVLSVTFLFAQNWVSFESGKRGSISPAQTALGYSDVGVTTGGAHPQCKVDLTIPGASITFPSDNGMLAGKYAVMSFTAKNARVMGYNINGTYRPEKLGEPELPFVRIQVKIPYSVNKVSVSAVNTKFNALEGKYKVAPVQQQLFESYIAGVHADTRTFQMNEQIYTADQYFSHDIEQETFICHGYKVLEIRYCPLQYNPVTQTLLATKSAQLVISYLDGQLTESNKKSIFTDVINRATFDGINGCINIVKNPIRGGKVAVVSHSTLLNGSAYSDWKAYREGQGYEIVKEIDASGMNASSIESELKSEYNSSEFEYVAVIGDWDFVPIPTDGSKYHYKNYSRLDGSDDMPDVGMGILLADDDATLKIIVDKQKKQEAGGAWSKTVMMAASLEDDGSNWDRFSSAHYVTRNMDNPNGGLGYTVHRVYKGSHTNYTSYGGGYGIPRTDFEPWALDPNPFVTSSTALRDKVADYWNTDENVIVGHRDHGSTSGPSPMSYSMFNGDITSDCSPLFTSLNCSSGNVKSTTSNFAYVSQIKEYGTCATIAATVTTYSGDNDYNHVALYEAMFPEDGSDPETNIGKAFLAGLMEAREHGRTYFHIWGDALTCLALGDMTPFVMLSAPMGGEEVEQFTAYTIRWRDNINGNVKIELLKGGTVVSEIAASTASDGSHEWDVGNTAQGTDYKVRITSIDDPSLTHQSASDFSIIGERIFEIPYHQDFNTWSRAMDYWEQSSDDDLDWTILSGPTPSREGGYTTGPEGDFPDQNGKYIYIEASGSNYPSKKASIITPKFNFQTVSEAKLRLYYHMYSGEQVMGDFFVDVQVGSDGTWEEGKISLTGTDYGDNWIEQQLDLNFIVSGSYTAEQKKRVRFRLRGITSDDTDEGWSSDICVDSFSIDNVTTGITEGPKNLTCFDMRFHSSKLKFFIPATMSSPVSIKLYNIQGKMVKTLVDGKVKAGYHMVKLNHKIAAGMYLCKMKAGSYSKTINVILTK
jgi:hypothetical protein